MDEHREIALQRIAEECLAGRLITRARLCKQVKNALEVLEWRKESVKIRPVQLPDGEEQPEGQRTLALALADPGLRLFPGPPRLFPTSSHQPWQHQQQLLHWQLRPD